MSSTNFLLVSLTVLFIGLKLTGFIAWSWWLVTLPLWGLAAIVVVLAIIVAFVAIAKHVFDR